MLPQHHQMHTDNWVAACDVPINDIVCCALFLLFGVHRQHAPNGAIAVSVLVRRDIAINLS